MGLIAWLGHLIKTVQVYIDKYRLVWDILLVLFGFCLALGWGYWQDFQTDKYTAQEVYTELQTTGNSITWLARDYQQGAYFEGIGHINFTAISGQAFTNPLSVYPSIRDNLCRFDPQLSRNITFFYENLMAAETDRGYLQEIQNIGPNTPISSITVRDRLILLGQDEIFNEMKDKIIYCANQIPIIEQQLHDIYGVQ